MASADRSGSCEGVCACNFWASRFGTSRQFTAVQQVGGYQKVTGRSAPLLHRPVDRVLEIRKKIEHLGVSERHQLGEDDAGDLFSGIDPE